MTKKEKIFAKWISSRKTLICDSSGTSRSGMTRSLIDMGAKMNNIIRTANFEQAEHELTKFKPHLVLTDYDVGPRCGLDLLQQLRKDNPEFKQSVFVLVTGNTSQSAVAMAAEEDVDTYILKPFTMEVLRNSILEVALQKINPSDYLKKIEEGKSKLESEKLDEAIKLFEEAIELDAKPALAYFYHGQAEYMKKIIDNAKGDYNTGLEFNKIHYKCLTGLFDVCMDQKEFTDAYDIVKKISRYFPANPERLSTVLRLAIMTESYEDVERYYQLFTSLEHRDELLIRYICAALVTCGKYYLKANVGSRAVELFRKAGVTAAGRTGILKEIIITLVDAGQAKECEEFLKRFPNDEAGKTGKDVMGLYISYVSTKVPGKILQDAMALEKKGIEDPYLSRIIFGTCSKIKKHDEAKRVAKEALEKWPKLRHLFLDSLYDENEDPPSGGDKEEAKTG
jgi:two-component system chemotaxis response regulator CheY